MSDQKALTDGTAAGLGRVDEDMALPQGARPITSGWMSGLMGRLTARTQRRGSLGFNDGGLSTPPARLGSQDEHWEGWEEGRKLAKEESRGLARQRNDSYNFLSSTPGGDGDQYHFKQRFGRRNNSESQDMSSLVGGDWEEETHTTSTLTDLPGGPPALPTLQEGVVINLSPPKEESTMYAQADPLRGVVTVRDPPSREEKGGFLKEDEEAQREGSIFLIDLEESKCNDGKTQLKPKSKKFSASSLLGSKLTQNWFFRREEDDLDNLVDETMEETMEEERSRKESSNSNTSTSSADSNQSKESGGRGSVMRKLKSLTDRNNGWRDLSNGGSNGSSNGRNNGWREINFGAPQGT